MPKSGIVKPYRPTSKRTDRVSRPILVLLNPSAAQGKAEQKWEKVRETVMVYWNVPVWVHRFEDFTRYEETLRDLIHTHHPGTIISAGGDGSVHYLINALMNSQAIDKRSVAIGAIGLGSSNDFHKPVHKQIRGIPVRINPQQTRQVDLGQVDYLDLRGRKQTRYFIANASIGVTADANYFFNHPNRILGFLKQHWVGGAILYAALSTIFSASGKNARIQFEGQTRQLRLNNLGVIKNPNISGGFRYDQDIQPDDGYLGLNYCHDMSTWELVRTLYQLGQGKFSGRPKRFSTKVKSLEVHFAEPVPLELDGEVFVGQDFTFRIRPRAISLLQN